MDLFERIINYARNIVLFATVISFIFLGDGEVLLQKALLFILGSIIIVDVVRLYIKSKLIQSMVTLTVGIFILTLAIVGLEKVFVYFLIIGVIANIFYVILYRFRKHEVE